MYDLSRVIAIDKALRSQRQKTVVMYACQIGYSGVILTDFGDEWSMFHSGTEAPRVPIKNISCAQVGRVTT